MFYSAKLLKSLELQDYKFERQELLYLKGTVYVYLLLYICKTCNY